MAYEFKKLSEIEKLDSVPDGATVLAEVDGVIRRVPSEGLGGSGTIPEFDLAAMGLPAVPIGGEQVSVECDTTEIMAAMEKGLVKLNFAVDMCDGNHTVIAGKLITAMGAFNGGYFNNFMFMALGESFLVSSLSVGNGGMSAQIHALALT